MNWLFAFIALVLLGVLLVATPFVLKEASFEGCQTADDCVTLAKESCGCTGGGAQIAVSKQSWYYRIFRRVDFFQGGTACPQMISEDASCKAQLKCAENKCVLG